MATHRLRFNSEWQDKNGGMSRFEIYERDFVGAHEEMEMREDPLTLERATLSNKFQPSIGSGVELRVTAAYDGQYAHLYTKDKQKFKALFYKNDQLIWSGYLNSEVSSEQFDRNKDYPVTLQFNDGFAVMERIPFKDENGNAYTDLKTAWEIIWIILDKLDINFHYVYLGLDTFEDSMNTLISPFHQMKLDCNNYYDEQGEALNCREVLNAIVRTQRAICFQNESCFNIVSVPLLTGSYERRRYTSEASAQVLQTVNPVLTIPTQADWYASDQNTDTVGGYSRATLKYSPYAPEQVIESSDFDDADTWEGDHEWDDVGDFFELKGVTGVKGWKFLNGATFSGTKEEEVDENQVYFKLPFENVSGEVVLIENNETGPLVTGVAQQGFKVSFDIYAATKNNEFDTDEESKKVFDIRGYFNIEIDGKRPDGFSADPWTWSVNSSLEYFKTSKTSNIADSWQTVEVMIPGNCPHGRIKLQILKQFVAYKDNNRTPVDSGAIDNIRIRNIEIEAVDITRYTSQSGRRSFNFVAADYSDIEIVAEIDDDWINEAETVEMIHGDSKENNCTDKGGIHLLDNSFTSLWRVLGDTESHEITTLILRAFESNYRDSLKKLMGTLESPNFFNGNGENIDGILSFHSVLTYPSTSLGSKKLMCMGGTYNDKRQTLNGTWLEVLPDDLTINSL